MPFDSEGKFTRIHEWEQDRIDDISIDSYRMDEEFNNYADGLSDTLLRDGRVPLVGNLNFGGFSARNVADGRLEKDAVNLSQLNSSTSTLNTTLKAIINKLVVVGDVKTSVKTSNHDNWILCNGQAISRSTYSELFAIIGTNFGGGDGSTTFNVPDYRGKFIRGLGGNSANNMYTTQAEGLPNITGGPIHIAAPGTTGTHGCMTSTSGNWAHNDSGGTGINISINASSSNSIYGKSSHVTPINQALNFFIKAKSEA